MHTPTPVRRVTHTYGFPRVTIDLMAARKGDNRILTEDGSNLEHIVGAEMATVGSLKASWRYIGSAGQSRAPCNPLSYVPADVPWGTTIAGIVCRFNTSLFHTITGLGGDWSPRHLEACRDLDSPDIRLHLEGIYHELLSPGFATDILIDTLANLILVRLARYFRAIPQGFSKGSSRGFSGGLRAGAGPIGYHDLLAMRRCIEAGDGKRISVTELAASIGYSTSHFHALFKESTGITPSSFTTAVRLQKAARLLGGGELPIKEIAWRTGFKSQSSFSTAFHKHTGQTPALARSGKYLPLFRYPRALPVTRDVLAANLGTSPVGTHPVGAPTKGSPDALPY